MRYLYWMYGPLSRCFLLKKHLFRAKIASMATVYNYSDYRSFLRADINARSERGVITKMAEAVQCQRSHLSRVLSDQLHLTTDQAFRITRFLHLTDEDSIYFMKLVEYERSGDLEYRSHLKRELKQLKTVQEDFAKRLKEPSIADSELERIYYSSWHWSAIHIIVSIPQYQTVEAISKRLNFSHDYIELCLQRLENFGLVNKIKNRWQIAGAGIHLSKSSPLNSVNHFSWRSKAVLDSQQPQGDGVHYTVVQSISRADFDKIKNMLISTIDEYVKIARPSKEEELICFTCDFFKV